MAGYTIAIPTLPKLAVFPSVPMPKAPMSQPSPDVKPSRGSLSQIDVNRPITIARHNRAKSPSTRTMTLPSLSNVLGAAGSSTARSNTARLPIPNIAREQHVGENGLFEMRTKPRRKTSPHELAALERSYTNNPLPSMADRVALSKQLDMPARSIQIWFQNRRQTDKKKTMSIQSIKQREPSPSQSHTRQPKSSQDWHEHRPRTKPTRPRGYHPAPRPDLHRSHSGSLEQLLQARERSFGASSSRRAKRSFGEIEDHAFDQDAMLDMMESDPPSMNLEDLQGSDAEMASESETESERSSPVSKRFKLGGSAQSHDSRRTLGHPYRPPASIIQRRTASLDHIASTPYAHLPHRSLSNPTPVRYFAPISTTRHTSTTDSAPTTPGFSRSPSVASAQDAVVTTPEVVLHVEQVRGAKVEDEDAIRAADALLALWGA